jgi:hypothetical protein
MTYDRESLEAIVAGRNVPETVGDGAWIEFRVRITPELLLQMLGTYEKDGRHVEFDGVSVQSDGLAYPLLRTVEPV